MKPHLWYHTQMKPQLLSAAKELLDYDASTGVFRWKKPPNRRIAVGTEAGWHHGAGYKRITIGREKIYAHRLAWAWVHGSIEKNIDHINGVTGDNRIENLRLCNQSQNIMNYKINSRNTTGVRGVSFDKDSKTWHVRLKAGDKLVRKRFNSFEDASSFSRETMKLMFGEFACTRGD